MVSTVVGLVLALIATGGALAVPAAAHDGVDHSAEPGAEPALDWSNYEKITLTKDTGEPIDMAVLPETRVVQAYGGTAMAIPFVAGYSTTALVKKIRQPS